jgi:hypothetical protein
MRLRRMLESLRPQHEVVASFGGAELVRTPDGKTELRGGTEADRQAAMEWISLFWHEASPRVRG